MSQDSRKICRKAVVKFIRVLSKRFKHYSKNREAHIIMAIWKDKNAQNIQIHLLCTKHIDMKNLIVTIY